MSKRQQYLLESKSELSERKRCELLKVTRSNLYYKPRVNLENSDITAHILDIWLEHSNKGWRSIQADLREYHQLVINHKRVRRLMQQIGIKGVIPKSSCTKSNPEHKKYPYLLKNMDINKANIAWCSDITYIKLPQGFVYLVAIVDIYSRAILDWEISNTLDSEFCIRTLERSILKYGAPAVFNTDQGVQYTSSGWINKLNDYNIAISMDGKGRWADNVWIERIWRTIKYEAVFLNGVENLIELKLILNKYIHYYNDKRLHSALGYKTPMTIYNLNKSLNQTEPFVLFCKLKEKVAVYKSVA